MNTFKGLAVATCAEALCLVSAPQEVSADAIADFYKGKRVKYIQSSPPGGGYDTYGRTLARHMPKHIAGHPTFIVQNMPGAGGILAANFIYNIAPQDGSVIGGVQRTVPMAQIMGHKGPKFISTKFNWLGSVSSEAGVLVVNKKSQVKTLEDVFTKSAFLGSTGPSDTEIYPALMNNLMGAKFKIIRGYPGSPDVHLAMQRGETHGISQSWSSFKVLNKRGIKAGKFIFLAQLSLTQNPELQKMGIPLIMDIVDRKHVLPDFSVEEAKTYWKLMLVSKAMGRPHVVGPNVPKARVKALRAAYMATVNDPGFIKDANAQGREVTPLSGDDVQKMIMEIASTPKPIIKKLETMITYKGAVKKVVVKLARHTGKVTKTKRGNRRIYLMFKGKEVKAKVSGSRTKVTLNGKKVKRKAVKVGMTCTFVYSRAGAEAKQVICKN